MSIRVVEDNKDFCSYLSSIITPLVKETPTLVETQDLTETRDLSSRLSDEAGSNDIFIINVDMRMSGALRQECLGIELLTWLRTNGIMNHCVLYSFRTAEGLARASDKNRLLFSAGTTFLLLPTDFSCLDFEVIAESKATKRDVTDALKTVFDVSSFRHKEANWWGVKQLWDVHTIASKGKFAEVYPANISSELSSLNNNIAMDLAKPELCEPENSQIGSETKGGPEATKVTQWF